MKQFLYSSLITAIFLWSNIVFGQTSPTDLGYSGNVTLSWGCDTCEVEGSTGFKIYYGSASQLGVTEPSDYNTPAPYDTVITILGGGVRSYELSGLLPGIWYYRITTFGSQIGTESAFSNEASGIVGIPPVEFLSCIYGAEEPPPMPISFSHVQNASAVNTDPATVTLGSAPTEGNLLVAAAMERSGGSGDDFTITGTGWTKRESLTVEQANSTFRRSMAIWTKVAGASESATITIDDGTANSKTAFVVEYSHGSGSATWTFEDSVSNHNGATENATSLSTGTTVSISAGDLLEVGILASKRAASTDTVTSSWTNSLTERADFGDGVSFGRQLILADYLSDTSSGTKSSTATISGVSTTNSGLMAAILVFSASEGGGAMAPPLFIPTIRRYQHLVVR